MNELRKFIPVRDLGQRIKWLIDLRWFACLGLFVAITVAVYVLKIELPAASLYIGNAVLFIYNIIFFFYSNQLDSQKDYPIWPKKVNQFANLQSSLDLLLLTYLIHLSGGLENPFTFFYIFHMVIASILLSNRAAYLQATFAIIIFGLVMGGESLGLLSHYHLYGYIPEKSCNLSFNYFLGRYLALIFTLYITVYMSTTIINILREREGELTIANEKLEEQDRQKSQYVLNVSHDIKSSLASIQTCLKVVLGGITGKIPKKSRDMITRAEQRSLSLYHFVEDLLDLSRIRAAKEIDKEKIPLSDVLIGVVEQLKPQIKIAGLTLIVDNLAGKSFIYANRGIIEGLFINLLLNAVKYTPRGGKIIFRAEEFRASPFVHISITDTGIGIPKEDLPYIFEDFYRASNAEEYVKEGTGLGLSIVKQIIELHGGKIHVVSKVGKGSSFIFTLSVNQPSLERDQ
jgi:signal transduction histidine kinase